MKFLIKEISPSRKEFRVTLNSTDIDNIHYYIFGSVDGPVDEGTIKSKYIPQDLSNYYSEGPNPAIIRLIVAYLKDTLGTPSGFDNTVLTLENNLQIPIVNIAIDDITLINLTSDTIPSMVIKLIEPLPTSIELFDEVFVEKQIITTQEQEVYYISAEEPPAVIRGLAYDEELKDEIGNTDLQKLDYESHNDLTSSFKHTDDTIIKEIISDNDINLKLDYSNFENHIHFGSAVFKLDNFVTKVKNIEDYLVQISQSLSNTGSLQSGSVNSLRKSGFDEIQTILDTFTLYEKNFIINLICLDINIM